MIRGILFDLDDTLYNERQFVEGGFRVVASRISQRYDLDCDKVYTLLLEVLDKHGRGQVFDISLQMLNLYDRKMIPGLVDAYRSCRTQLAMFKEVEDVLRILKKEGYRLGLITDGDTMVQKNKVKALGIEGVFDCLVFTNGYDIGREKPDTFSYRKALEELEISAEQSIYVGDNPHKDFIGAKKIGMLTVRVMRGQYKTVKLQKEYEANFRVTTLRGIFRILNRFQKKR